MAESESTNPVQRVGMDMTAPYGVYMNGEKVAEYDNEQDAEAHFQRLKHGS